MGLKVDDTVLDGTLDIIATATEIYVLPSEPADRAACISTNILAAAHTLTGGDFANADDTSGRKVTISSQADLTINGAGGTATHVAISSAALLLLVTTCDSQVLGADGTVTIPAFKYNSTDPTVA